MNTTIDEQVVFDFCQGSEHAFFQIYTLYHPNIYCFALKYFKNEEIAEDVTHDTFLRLWQYRSRINPKLPLINYLYRIARNVLFKELKKYKGNLLLKEQLLAEYENQQLLSACVHTSYQTREYSRILEQAINHLPAQRQRVFKLCKQEGKTYKETANQLGISTYTVKEHVSLAMKFIKKYLITHADLVFGILLWFNYCSTEMLR